MTRADVAEQDVDVVVVGGGGGGLVAALAAADAGASVVVLEKLDECGGNTALSTGSIPAAGTRFQAEFGIEDSPERMAEDLLRQSGPHDTEQLLHRLAETSAETVEWLVDRHGVQLKLIEDYKHVGHSVNRLHAPASRRGGDLVRDLLRACTVAGVEIATGNPVVGLMSDDGRVNGVVVEGPRVRKYGIRAHAVVLAANGFAANAELVKRWAPDLADLEYFGAHGSTGEAIEWGLDLGGQMQNQDAYQGYAAVAYPHGSLTSWTTVEKGGVIVDATGSRLGDETLGYSGFTTVVSAAIPPVWVIYDRRIGEVAMREEEFAELNEIGGVRDARDLSELANLTRIPIDSLKLTLEDYDRAARGEAVDMHGRTDFGLAPLEPPYMATRVVPGLFHTQGGLAVDTEGRVTRAVGGVMPGLYAIGGVAAGVSGATGGRGYSSGNGLLSAIGLGRLAGRHAGGNRA